jgi:hypothetical protein
MDNDKNIITGYPKAGLNKYMMPVGAPITQGSKFINAIDWDILHPRDTVSSMHVKNISFSSLTGGTATLGGVSNGDGLLIVNNAGGTQVVRLDNTGIVITAGTISGVQFTGTTTQFTGTFDAITLTGQSVFNGTVTNNKLITGGTLGNAAIGTPLLSAGTVNPSIYQASGTPEAAGSFVYIKSVNFAGSTTTLGTVQFKGIIYSNA